MRALLLLMVLSPASGVRSEDPTATEYTIVSDIRTSPAACDRHKAEPVDFAALLADSTRWNGRCVSVSGYIAGGSALYADANAAREQSDKAEVGLYNRKLLRRIGRGGAVYTAIGRVGDCAQFGSQGVEVSGYCHVRVAGPYIALAALHRR